LVCDECKQRVRALNETAGRCVVPIGRHSLMNSVNIEGRSLSGADQLLTFISATTSVEEWGRKTVLGNLVALGSVTTC